MGQHENSDKSVKFIVTNCIDRFKLSIPITCIRISEAVTRRCSVKKVLLKISQNSQEKIYARVSFSFALSSVISKVFVADFEHVFMYLGDVVKTH